MCPSIPKYIHGATSQILGWGDGAGLRKSSIRRSQFGKKRYYTLKIKKNKLQLNSFFGYDHRVRESYGVQLKEGNSWTTRWWKSHHINTSWMKPWIKYSLGSFNPIWSTVCHLYPCVHPTLTAPALLCHWGTRFKERFRKRVGPFQGSWGGNKCKNKNMKLTFQSIFSSTQQFSCFDNFFPSPPHFEMNTWNE